MTTSLLIIVIQQRQKLYSSAIGLLPEKSQNVKSFFRYLKKLISNKNNLFSFSEEDGIITTSLQFSPNPDLSKGEAVIHAMTPVIVRLNMITSRTGGSQCLKPYEGAIMDLDIPPISFLNNEMYGGVGLASHDGKFALLIKDADLDKFSAGNFILKFVIDNQSEFNNPEVLEKFIKKLGSDDSIKAIEIVLSDMSSTPYSLSDMMNKKNNRHFNDYNGLLNFILKLRYLSEGKPIGIRMGIKDKNDFTKFISLVHMTGKMPDFITLIGNKSATHSFKQNDTYYSHLAMPIDYAVAFAGTELKKYKLENEIKIWAAGEIDNGFDLLKLIALGADKCISVKRFHFFSEISDNYFFDDAETVVKSNTLFTYRRIIRELIQIMEHAGFIDAEQVDAKMFFRRINKSTIKSFDEIYFKSRENNWDVLHDYIHLN